MNTEPDVVIVIMNYQEATNTINEISNGSKANYFESLVCV